MIKINNVELTNPDSTNKLFQLAAELVIQSSRNIFLTGKAGTGKTTFLKYIRENCPKRMAVAAPTGVAAINAGGVTIHSLFQLPLSPFIPESRGFQKEADVVSRHNLLSRLRMNSEKKKVLEELDLLVIDEISMVRCDTLDAVDSILRHVRNRQQDLFGGVQVLFIGDMFQLPPVIKDDEWKLLSGFYNSPYFFDSQVIRQEQPLYIEFEKIYRQTDEVFINLLNQVRNNDLDETGRSILEGRFNPVFRRTRDDGYIILTTHNETARNINAEKLRELDERIFSYRAEVTDDFPSNAFPADEILDLKLGSQVMFIKNDADRNRRYFNGKIGKVSRLEEDKIYVQCKDEPDEIEVKRQQWDNIRYNLNKATRQLEEKTLGSFSQYPLRLAWAITIHKSQGLTFEKAVIDAGKSFAMGQVYVALSRCTSLEGMVLQSRIQNTSLQTDPRIVNFSNNRTPATRLEQELLLARADYRKKIILELFDFNKSINTWRELVNYTLENRPSFNQETFPWLDEVLKLIGNQQEIAIKFQRQLQGLFNGPDPKQVDQRVKAGAIHFAKGIEGILQKIQASPCITDSRIHAREFNEEVKDIFIELSLRQYLLSFEGEALDIPAYHASKRIFKAPVFTVNAYSGAAQRDYPEMEHLELYQRLRKLRDQICEKRGVPVYMVAGSQTLQEITSFLPQNLNELAAIRGFGPARLKAHGQQFLEIVVGYCEENGLGSKMAEKSTNPKRSPKKPIEPGIKTRKKETKLESLELFRKGMMAGEIARERKLALSTIEGHLALLIEAGKLHIDELVNPERLLRIQTAINEMGGVSLTQIRESLGNEFGFGEIRWVCAWLKFQKQELVNGPGRE